MILIEVAELPRNPNTQSLTTVANTQATVTAHRLRAYFDLKNVKCKNDAHLEFENKIVVIPDVIQEISHQEMKGTLRFTNKVIECCCSEFKDELGNIIKGFM